MIMSTPDFEIRGKSSPKKAVQESSEVSYTKGLPDKYPIYWIRVLLVLDQRKKLEKEYKTNPQLYKTRDEDFSDLEYEGFRQDDLNENLSNIMSNSNIRTIDYRDLFLRMQEESAQYVNSYEDKKGNTRYRITFLGELALKEKDEKSALSGFWEIVDNTQLPGKEKGTRDILRKVKR